MSSTWRVGSPVLRLTCASPAPPRVTVVWSTVVASKSGVLSRCTGTTPLPRLHSPPCGATSTARGTTAVSTFSAASWPGRSSGSPTSTLVASSSTGPWVSHRNAPCSKSSSRFGSNGSLSTMNADAEVPASSTSTGLLSRSAIRSSPSNLVSSNVSIGNVSSVGPPLTNVSVPDVGVYSSPGVAIEVSCTVAKSTLT